MNERTTNNVRINVEAERENEQLIEHGPQNRSDDDSDSAQQNNNNNTQPTDVSSEEPQNNTIQEIHSKPRKKNE